MKTKTKTKQTVITAAPAANLPAQVDGVAAASRQVVNLVTAALNNPKLDPRRMREFMDLQMIAIRYQAEVSYNHAMRDCQAEIPQIPANCENKHTKSKYANLEAIDSIVRPIIAKHGFSLNTDTDQVDAKHIKVIITVRHIDGHKEVHKMVGELDDGGFKGTANKTGIQAAGSSSSYLVRYLIKMIFNVVIIGEDKDGNTEKPKPAEENFNDRMRGDTKTEVDLPRFKADLTKIKKKADRVKFINDNLDVLRALDKDGKADEVAALHALADKGE